MKRFALLALLLAYTSPLQAEKPADKPIFSGTGPRLELAKIGPQADVAIPADFVKINVGESWQAKIDAHPRASGFRIAAGVHKNQTIVPRLGMQFWGEPGAIVDGAGTTRYLLADDGASNLKFRNLVIRNYKAKFQDAVIGNCPGLMVENCEISGTLEGYGTYVGQHLVRSRLHHNAQGSWVVSKTDGSIVEDNEISHDNIPRVYTGYHADWTTKLFETKNVKVRYNYVHDMNMIGIYSDVNNFGSEVHHNRIDKIAANGIEIAKGYDSVIHHNWVTRCQPSGGPDFKQAMGIKVYTSSNVHVHDNIVGDCWGGIFLQSDDRAGDFAAGKWQTKNCQVRNNKVSNCTVLAQIRRGDDPLDTAGAEANNKYALNAYQKGSALGLFQINGDNLTWQQWQAAGRDKKGTFVP